MDRKPVTGLMMSYPQGDAKELNKSIARETLDILQKKIYRVNDKKVDLCLKTGIYEFDQMEVISLEEQKRIRKDADHFMKTSFYEPEEHKIEIIRGDALDLAKDYFRPFLLVPVNLKKFGSELMDGALTLQADFLRRSTLFAALVANTGRENVSEGEASMALYLNESAAVFRNAYNQLIEHPYPVSFMCAEPVILPEGGRGFLQDPTVVEPMKEKIRNILMMAARKMYRNLILSPFGCMEAGHSKEAVAAYFYSVLVDEQYQNYFEKVIFAIPDWMEEQTIEAFKRMFIKRSIGLDKKEPQLKMMSDSVSSHFVQMEYPFPTCNYDTKEAYHSHLLGFCQGVFFNGVPYVGELFHDSVRRTTSINFVLPFFDQSNKSSEYSSVKRISDQLGNGYENRDWATILCRGMKELSGYDTQNLLLAYLDFLVLSGGLFVTELPLSGDVHIYQDFCQHKTACVHIDLICSGQVTASVPFHFWLE